MRLVELFAAFQNNTLTLEQFDRAVADFGPKVFERYRGQRLSAALQWMLRQGDRAHLEKHFNAAAIITAHMAFKERLENFEDTLDDYADNDSLEAALTDTSGLSEVFRIICESGNVAALDWLEAGAGQPPVFLYIQLNVSPMQFAALALKNAHSELAKRFIATLTALTNSLLASDNWNPGVFQEHFGKVQFQLLPSDQECELTLDTKTISEILQTSFNYSAQFSDFDLLPVLIAAIQNNQLQIAADLLHQPMLQHSLTELRRILILSEAICLGDQSVIDDTMQTLQFNEVSDAHALLLLANICQSEIDDQVGRFFNESPLAEELSCMSVSKKQRFKKQDASNARFKVLRWLFETLGDRLKTPTFQEAVTKFADTSDLLISSELRRVMSETFEEKRKHPVHFVSTASLMAAHNRLQEIKVLFQSLPGATRRVASQAALVHAARNGNVEVVDWLLQSARSHKEQRQIFGNKSMLKAIREAVSQNRTETATRLIVAMHSFPKFQTQAMKLLKSACQSGNVVIVKAICSRVTEIEYSAIAPASSIVLAWLRRTIYGLSSTVRTAQEAHAELEQHHPPENLCAYRRLVQLGVPEEEHHVFLQSAVCQTALAAGLVTDASQLLKLSANKRSCASRRI